MAVVAFAIARKVTALYQRIAENIHPMADEI
jgi:hypothetical protein